MHVLIVAFNNQIIKLFVTIKTLFVRNWNFMQLDWTCTYLVSILREESRYNSFEGD